MHTVPPAPWSRRAWLCAGLAAALPARAARPVVPMAVSQAISRTWVEPFLGLLGEVAQLEWTLSYVPFTRLLAMAQRGEALGFGIAHTPERDERLAFSRTLFSSGIWAVSLRERPVAARTPADLKGLRVCMVPGSHYGTELEAARGKLFEVADVSGDLAGRLRMLQAGRCDALLATHRTADPALLEQRLREAGGRMDVLMVGPQPLVELPVQIGVAKGSALAAYLPRIDQALRSHEAPLRQLLDRPG